MNAAVPIVVAVIAALLGGGLIGFLTYRRTTRTDATTESAAVIHELSGLSSQVFENMTRRIDQLQKEVDRCEREGVQRDGTVEELKARVVALQAGQSAILDTIHDGVVLVNPSGRITFANAALLRLTGWALIDLIGEPIHSLVPDNRRVQHRENVKEYLLNPTPRRMGHGLDLSIVHKDGHEMPVHISLSPQGSGEVLAIVHAT